MDRRIMLIGSNESDMKKMEALLNVLGYDVVTVKNLNDAKLLYQHSEYFLVIAFYNLEDGYGSEFYDWILQIGYPQNFLLVSNIGAHKHVAGGKGVPFLLLDEAPARMKHIMEHFHELQKKLA